LRCRSILARVSEMCFWVSTRSRTSSNQCEPSELRWRTSRRLRRRHAFKSYLRSTIWTVPLFAIVAEQVSFRVLMALSPGLGGIPGFTYSQDGTVAAMDWVIGSSITYMTFAFGMLLVAIQVSGGQLTPRIVATALLRDNAIRLSLGLFVYTLMLAVSVKL